MMGARWRLGRAVVAALFPPRCSACGAWLDPSASDADGDSDPGLAGVLCPDCRQALALIEGPVCTRCGQPFESFAGRDHWCGRCLEASPPYDMARSAGIYGPPLKTLIHRLKYNGRLQMARPLGELLRAAFWKHWRQRPVDAVVPVPLHRRRLRERGFNQVGAMVRCWARPGPEATHAAPVRVPVLEGILVRDRHTVAQAGLDRRERVRNLRAAFRVSRPEAVQGRCLLLIDDVMTTGATVVACAEALQQAGARRVDVLTLARAL